MSGTTTGGGDPHAGTNPGEGQPVFNSHLVVNSSSMVIDSAGRAWWVDLEAKTLTRALVTTP